ncbi:MAG TPA: GNAT family N-acetyltransferase [Aggregatilineales bacterium]|jgi:ribosomal protein S18 acetylase RimI-like enzyme|nr:GNAT family N-acetyltransferase [Aggregatilineales bacterium]
MVTWDTRITRHWAEQLQLGEDVFEQTGLVLRFAPGSDEQLVTYAFGDLRIACLTERYAARFQSAPFSGDTLDALAQHLGITLTLAWRDFIYYATRAAAPPYVADGVRPLTAEDAPRLAALQAQCSEAELRLSEISIDDPVIIGCFRGDDLAGVASLLERAHDIYDIGVLTHPAHRGQNIAAALTARLRNDLTEGGKVAQYITMESNHGSVRVAEKCQFPLRVVEEGFTITDRP